MKLINTSSLELHDFSLSEIPRHAILSHTWGDDEVTFQDMSSPSRSFNKSKGYAKIMNTCRLALEHSLGYAWVDTCCIDKSSSAELTESINSIFQWYKNAEVCYVFLDDLPPDTSAEAGLARCRWFTRGWTLQELLAPRRVDFYDMAWKNRASKLDFVNTISSCTGIPILVLHGDLALADCFVAMRMAWAAHRQTTRVEDIAYCLLGIFGTQLPLIYGEGLKSFRRLQEEIVKRNKDLTIFAWDVPQSHMQQFLGLFAISPAEFANSSRIKRFADVFSDLSITNMGLLASGGVPLRGAYISEREGDRQYWRYLLFVGADNQATESGVTNRGICLRKIGPRLFHRDGNFTLADFGRSAIYHYSLFEVTDYCILIDPVPASFMSSSAFRDCAVHVPLDDVFTLSETAPETLWDLTDRVFLRPKPYNWVRFPMAITMSFCGTIVGKRVSLVVLCDYRTQVPICKVFIRDKYLRQAEMIFNGRHRNDCIFWADLEYQAQELVNLNNSVEIAVGAEVVSILVSFERGIIESTSSKVELFSLKFNITRRLDSAEGSR